MTFSSFYDDEESQELQEEQLDDENNSPVMPPTQAHAEDANADSSDDVKPVAPPKELVGL